MIKSGFFTLTLLKILLTKKEQAKFTYSRHSFSLTFKMTHHIHSKSLYPLISRYFSLFPNHSHFLLFMSFLLLKYNMYGIIIYIFSQISRYVRKIKKFMPLYIGLYLFFFFLRCLLHNCESNSCKSAGCTLCSPSNNKPFIRSA